MNSPEPSTAQRREAAFRTLEAADRTVRAIEQIAARLDDEIRQVRAERTRL